MEILEDFVTVPLVVRLSMTCLVTHQILTSGLHGQVNFDDAFLFPPTDNTSGTPEKSHCFMSRHSWIARFRSANDSIRIGARSTPDDHTICSSDPCVAWVCHDVKETKNTMRL